MTIEAKFASNRQLQVGEIVRRALADVINQDIYHPELEATSVTVAEVRMTSDLKLADAFVLPMIGSKIDNNHFIKILQGLAPQIRVQLNKKVKLRFSPELRFKLDTSFDQAMRIRELLK